MMHFKQSRCPRICPLCVHTTEIAARTRILLKESVANHLVTLNRKMSTTDTLPFWECIAKTSFSDIAYNAGRIVGLKLCNHTWKQPCSPQYLVCPICPRRTADRLKVTKQVMSILSGKRYSDRVCCSGQIGKLGKDLNALFRLAMPSSLGTEVYNRQKFLLTFIASKSAFVIGVHDLG